ncbi:MAG: hypothetical protein A2007_03995 [Verrucomicrobia bacterium GWC2_42_7]|nr:MAG: hypothetical protein A2007_03995 [Verrucomicrobia bacterium GWC2_42_7]
MAITKSYRFCDRQIGLTLLFWKCFKFLRPLKPYLFLQGKDFLQNSASCKLKRERFSRIFQHLILSFC